MFIVIPDPGSKKQQQKRGVKTFCCHTGTGTFFCSHKFHKIENYLIFEMLKKKIRASFQRIIEFLLKKLSLCSQKSGFGIRDPGSEIRDPEKTNSRSRKHQTGVKKALDPGFRIRNTDCRYHLVGPVVSGIKHLTIKYVREV
jgi:hypothetical protein